MTLYRRPLDRWPVGQAASVRWQNQYRQSTLLVLLEQPSARLDLLCRLAAVPMEGSASSSALPCGSLGTVLLGKHRKEPVAWAWSGRIARFLPEKTEGV